MNEFNHVTNKEIRRKARALLKSRFGCLVGITLLMVLIASAPTFLLAVMSETMYSGGAATVMYYIVYLGAMVLSIGMSIGYQQICRDVWNGEPTGVGKLFSKFNRIPRMLGISIIMSLLVTVAYVPMAIVAVIGVFMESTMAIVLMALAIAAIVIAIIWAEMRFMLAPCCIVIRPELGIFECLRASWIATKGKVWRLICNMFWLSLPMTVMMVLTSLLLGIIAAILNLDVYGIYLVIYIIVIVLVSIVAESYLMLGQYGLAEYLLNGAETGVPVLANYGVWPAPEQPVPSGHFEDFQPEPIALPGETDSIQPEEADEDEYNPDEHANEYPSEAEQGNSEN